MVEMGTLRVEPALTGIGGYWSYDAVNDLAFGDAVTISYLKWRSTGAGVTMDDVLAQIAQNDRQRIKDALRRSAEQKVIYQQRLSIDTQQGWRQIFAIGHCLPSIYKDCSMLSGWFVDITDGHFPAQFARTAATAYTLMAQSAASAAKADLAQFILEDALLELEDRTEDGVGARRF